MSAIMAERRPLRSRLLPFGGRRAGRLIERNLFVYRNQWTVLVSGFFEPIFYLLGIGFGIGALIGDVQTVGGQTISYAEYVAPALLASAAFNGALMEATYNFYFKLRWQRTYDSILATPLSLGDVALGELVWAATRAAIYCVGFLVVSATLGLIASPTAILAIPAALLMALAVGALAMAGSTFMRYWTDLDLITLIVLPIFLFSGTFYPVSIYPPALQVLVWFSPLFHGIEMTRSLMLGILDGGLAIHVLVLVVYTVIGFVVCSRRLNVLLIK
jgi:lipooligosaccharide transport system permease protein